jgi:hypothetical protein
LLSWRGYCGACGPILADENADALHYKTGDGFTHWRRSMAACVGGVLLDEPPTRP